MANTLSRDKARKMRTKGKSLNEITQCLRVPKSTVRYWCRDISLSETQLQSLSQKQKIAGILASEKARQERIHTTQRLFDEGVSEISQLNQRELFLLGIALYWAKGYRKGDGEFGFTNSDPRMIRFIIRWLQESCKIPREKIYSRICINSIHKGRINVINEFWSKNTSIPLKQFTKPTFINVKSKKRYLNSSEYFGTLRIKVRQSTNLRRKISGWIGGLANNTLPA